MLRLNTQRPKRRQSTFARAPKRSSNRRVPALPRQQEFINGIIVEAAEEGDDADSRVMMAKRELG